MPPQTTSRPGEDVPACTDCGACCRFEEPRYVMLYEDDSVLLGKRAEDLTHWIRGRCFMRVVDGHCIALRHEGDQWLCSIYEQRPLLCREFERGSNTCRTLVQLGRSKGVGGEPIRPHRLADPAE